MEINKIEPTAPLYPLIHSVRVENEQVNAQSEFVHQIQDSRKRELERIYNDLITMLEHYEKVKRRWNKIDSGVKIIGVTLTSLTATTSAIIAPFNFVVLASVVAALSAGKAIFTQTFTIGYTSKKVKQYREINKQINYSINKLYLFNQKALSDNILSIEEIKEAHNIWNSIKKDINNIKCRK